MIPHLLAAVALVSALGLPDQPGPVPQDAPERVDRPTTRTVVMDGVSVRLPWDSHQVITVNRTSGYRARVILWTWRRGDGWSKRDVTRDGRIGYGGLVPGSEREQGTGTTPLGTYRLLSSFGTTGPRTTWDLAHRRIRSGDHWVQDNESAYYNRYRHRSQGGFRWWLPSSHRNGSERLTDYPVQYELAVNTSFNRNQVRYRGAGIFLHVNGRGATAGCISVPRLSMVRAMAILDPARHPVIAIGR